MAFSEDSLKVSYDHEDFNNRIEAIHNEGVSYTHIAEDLSISNRQFLRYRKGLVKNKEKAYNLNKRVIKMYETVYFPVYYVILLIHKFTKNNEVEWIEIEYKEYSGYEKAYMDYDNAEIFHSEENNEFIEDKMIEKNPLMIAGRLRYWINRYDVKNHREASILILKLESDIKGLPEL